MSDRKLVFRSPRDRRFEVDVEEEFAVLDMESPAAANGRWVINQEDTRSTFFNGIHHGSRLERIDSTLVFNSEMNDVGAEFVVILHSKGLTVVCLAVSPEKCPLPQYHNYLESYINLLGFPGGENNSSRSVRGTPSEDGRTSIKNETGFSLLTQAVRVNSLVPRLKRELQKHERGRGGQKGVHPAETIRAWRSHQDWYEVKDEPGEDTVKVGGHDIDPLQVVPREGRGSNRFLGAVATVLENLAGRMPANPYGKTASTILSISKRHIESFDTLEDLNIRRAWQHLKRNDFPPYSTSFVESLAQIRDQRYDPPKRRPSLDGYEPYYLPTPEHLFQWYTTARLLIALDVDPGDVQPIIHELQQNEEVQVGNYSIWADNDEHDIPGWRDRTHSPSNYQPDIVVINRDSDEILLADAKFRLHKDNTKLLTHGSIKDIQAYMQEYGLDKSLILVPSKEDRPDTEDIENGEGFRICGISVPPETPDFEVSTAEDGTATPDDFTEINTDTELGDSVREMWNARIRHNTGTNDE